MRALRSATDGRLRKIGGQSPAFLVLGVGVGVGPDALADHLVEAGRKVDRRVLLVDEVDVRHEAQEALVLGDRQQRRLLVGRVDDVGAAAHLAVGEHETSGVAFGDLRRRRDRVDLMQEDIALAIDPRSLLHLSTLRTAGSQSGACRQQPVLEACHAKVRPETGRS